MENKPVAEEHKVDHQPLNKEEVIVKQPEVVAAPEPVKAVEKVVPVETTAPTQSAAMYQQNYKGLGSGKPFKQVTTKKGDE